MFFFFIYFEVNGNLFALLRIERLH